MLKRNSFEDEKNGSLYSVYLTSDCKNCQLISNDSPDSWSVRFDKPRFTLSVQLSFNKHQLTKDQDCPVQRWQSTTCEMLQLYKHVTHVMCRKEYK
ncbi:hypothetical protein BLOT_009255 [Blomia tropicalis]|nr:hypothetical protein BLOT_009255 [Blomia tropicalis]